jgi:hypothetical protein
MAFLLDRSHDTGGWVWVSLRFPIPKSYGFSLHFPSCMAEQHQGMYTRGSVSTRAGNAGKRCQLRMTQ